MTVNDYTIIFSRIDKYFLTLPQFCQLKIFFQFDNGRFEMIIILPSRNRGLRFFYEMAKRADKAGPNIEDEGNLLNEALDAINNVTDLSENHVINMPSFKVDSNIDVEKHLRKVI